MHKPSEIKPIIKQFGTTTSVKGISKIIKSKNYGLKLIWLIAVIGGATTSLYFCTTLIVSYFSYNSYTKMTICNDCEPPFPDITICNLNPLAFFTDVKGTLLQFEQYLEGINNISATIRNSNITDERDRHQYIFGELYSLAGYFNNVHLGIALAATNFTQEGLIHHCEWYDWSDRRYDKQDCMTSHLLHVTTEFYACKTLQLKETNKYQVKGLEALIYLNDFTDDMMPHYQQHILRSQAKGARILLHPHGTFPDVTKGFNIAPGHEVAIYVSAENFKRIGEPYSNCTDQVWLEDSSSDTSLGLGFASKYVYTDTAATGLCKQDNMFKHCGCYHPSLPLTEQLVLKYLGLPGCIRLLDLYDFASGAEITYENAVKMINRVDCYLYSNQSNDASNCSLPLPCSEYQYKYYVTQSPWPHESSHLSFYCRYIDRDCTGDSSSIVNQAYANKFDVYKDIKQQSSNNSEKMKRLKEIDLISSNFIQLKVMFSDSGLVKYNEVAAITADFFFGAFGGTLNLWIGITFFTIVELVDLLFTICTALTKKRFKTSTDAEPISRRDKTHVYPFTTNFGGNDVAENDINK